MPHIDEEPFLNNEERIRNRLFLFYLALPQEQGHHKLQHMPIYVTVSGMASLKILGAYILILYK